MIFNFLPASVGRPRPRHPFFLATHFDICPGQVSAMAAAANSLESKHSSAMEVCVAHIDEHVQEACLEREPSGGTPEKKSYPRPETFR